MKTIGSHVHLKPGAGRDWDAVMRRRLSAATKRPGWVGGQLLRPADKEDKRVIVGTWRTRADWDAWGVYEFSGQASLGQILAGVVCTKAGVAPTGFEPVFSALRGDDMLRCDADLRAG